MRPTVLENNERTFKKLGVDSISFSPNWKIVKRLMQESLKRKGDFCWHCHTGYLRLPNADRSKIQCSTSIWESPLQNTRLISIIVIIRSRKLMRKGSTGL